MNHTYPSVGVSARVRQPRRGLQMPAHSSIPFSVQLSVILALSAYSAHALAQDSAPDVVTSAARTSQAVTDALNSTTLISRADIESATVSDVASLLRQQVGVSIRQNGTQGSVTGVAIRGGEPRHTLVLIDGVPLSSLSSGQAAIEQIPLSLIDRIEVVRGNVSALYGSQATGGLVQIFTRKLISGSQADVRLAIGDKGQKQASVQMSTGNDQVQLTAGIAHEQVKAVSARNSPSVNPDLDGYRNNSGNISVRFTPNERNEFGARFFQSNGRYEYDDNSKTATPYTKNKVEQLSAYSNNQLTDEWNSQFKVSEMTDRSNDSVWGVYQTKTQDVSWQNQLTTQYGTGITGISYTKQKLNSDTAYDKTQRTTKSAWLGYNLDKNRHHLQLNGRFDDVSDVGRYTTGAINYGFDVTSAWRVFAGYSNGFTTPSFSDLFYPGSENPNLKPEKATYMQVGAQYVQKNYGTRVTYFESRYKDKLVWVTTNLLTYDGQMRNVDRAKAQGVELHGWYNNAGWNVDAGVTYQDVKDRTTGAWLVRQPRVLANLSVGKTWNQWQAQADWNVQSHMKDSGGKTVSGFGVLNTSLFYSPRKDLKLGLTVGNVFDRKYQPIAGYNAMPRNFLFSVNYKPQW